MHFKCIILLDYLNFITIKIQIFTNTAATEKNLISLYTLHWIKELLVDIKVLNNLDWNARAITDN